MSQANHCLSKVCGAAAIAVTGGWASILRKRPSDPLTDADIGAIQAYVLDKIKADFLLGLAAEASGQITQTMNGIRVGLTPFLGGPISAVPDDLGTLPAVRQGVTGFTGNPFDVLAGAIGGLVPGLQDIATRGLVLGGIVVLILLGARRLL